MPSKARNAEEQARISEACQTIDQQKTAVLYKTASNEEKGPET